MKSLTRTRRRRLVVGASVVAAVAVFASIAWAAPGGGNRSANDSPGDVWETHGGQAHVPAFGGATVASLTLPVGNYVVLAKVEMFNPTALGSLSCSLVDSLNRDDSSGFPATVNSEVSLSLQTLVTYTGKTTIKLSCFGGTDATANRWHLTAIKVGSVH